MKERGSLKCARPFSQQRVICFFIPFFFLLLGNQQAFAHTLTDTSGRRVIVASVVYEGNKITRSGIINREMAFQPGDTLSAGAFQAALAKSRQNLLNTSLFIFVDVNLVYPLNTDTVPGIEQFSRPVIYFRFRERLDRKSVV